VKSLLRGVLPAVLVLGVPGLALACPVCFGQNDSPLASAMNQGIFMMLIVVAVVLAAFATFFIHLIRRAKLAERAEAARQMASDRTYLTGQEGTV
jgi:hypothetical protein